MKRFLLRMLGWVGDAEKGPHKPGLSQTPQVSFHGVLTSDSFPPSPIHCLQTRPSREGENPSAPEISP